MIIGITGRIAAGKETLTSFLRKKEFIYFETSKMLAQELEKRGLEVNRWNMQNLGDELREREGVGGLMKMLLEKTEPGKNYIFDSLRNPGEADFLKENVKDFVLIGVDAPQKIRFERILKRNKPSDPKTWEEFLKIDARDKGVGEPESGQQNAATMAMADFQLYNDGDIGSIHENAKLILGKVNDIVNQKNSLEK